MKIKILFTLTLLSSCLYAQAPTDADQNAALRYWNAFAQMRDTSLSDAQVRQLDAIVAGSAPWDETQFGKFLNDNKGAIETMVRGTALRYCSWGIDFDLGAFAPIPQIARGRALARLNLLEAQRLALQGDSAATVAHLSAGIRFAQDLSKNMSLIGALTGKLALTNTLNSATALVRSGKISPEDAHSLLNTVQNLRFDVFDWAEAAQIESRSAHDHLVELSSSADPAKLLSSWGIDFKNWGTQLRPSTEEIRSLDQIEVNFQQLLRKRSGPQIDVQVADLWNRIQNLGPSARWVVPNFQRIYDSKKQSEQLRKDFLQLAGKSA